MTSVYTVQLPGPPPITRQVAITPLGEGRYEVAIDDGGDNGVGAPEIIDARRIGQGEGPPAERATWSLLPAGGGPQQVVDIEGRAPDLKIAFGEGEPIAVKVQATAG